MHFLILLTTLGLAWWVRWRWSGRLEDWNLRWQSALGAFLFAPTLIAASSIAVLCMGPHGQMVWHGEGWLSYGLALVFWVVAIVLALKLTWNGCQTLRQTRKQVAIDLSGPTGRLLETSTLYSAQIGFWQPELVVSRGLLDTLSADQLEAVLVHEQAHLHYRDTFWFFWLGWLRRLTAWLPQTETLWQELLALRELRADRWAVQYVDSLLLAEALLLAVSQPIAPEPFGAAFASLAPPDRLEQRIEALLLTEAEPVQPPSLKSWIWLLLALSPLVAIPFHT
ncbi:MAG TPA: M48 family metalloprotease [Thermosynechococcaceae cyanobacterium]